LGGFFVFFILNLQHHKIEVDLTITDVFKSLERNLNELHLTKEESQSLLSKFNQLLATAQVSLLQINHG
jgi:uncharacterized protein YoxC